MMTMMMILNLSLITATVCSKHESEVLFMEKKTEAVLSPVDLVVQSEAGEAVPSLVDPVVL